MKIIIALLVSAIAIPAFAGQVRGYVRKDGTYVAPHFRSAPNSTRMDNYSTQGNINPYTGQMGSSNPYGSPQMAPSPSYLPPPPPLYTPGPSYQPFRP
jgi:hypothetical protein